MPRPAVPQYLGTSFGNCPPGHLFTLYGAWWEANWTRVRNINPTHLQLIFDRFPHDACDLRNRLIERQDHLASALGGTVVTFGAKSISPFVTGTGIEHPLENGMAFMNPYGLPYLPGSGVKGVLRRAAEELAGEAPNVQWGINTGWTRDTITTLFGKSPPPGSDDAERGALTFWDVFPRCDGLYVEIMNPHYRTYYEGSSTPHDAGNPVPIFFLTVPAGICFSFRVQCDLSRLQGTLAAQWHTLLREAFEHAFAWIGFGAKTAVGYGHMKLDAGCG